ncbi:MAG: tryptophan synthase subunit alpha [Actinomycetota bacterium]
MSVSAVLAAAHQEGRAALIGYLPVGFPDLLTSIQAMQAMVKAGVDIIEVGVPYSDPLMDGEVIQHAVESSLRAGTRVRDTFKAVEAIAEAGASPLVMTYWNLVDRWGVADFAATLAAAGGAGLVTPDLIPEEATSWLSAAEDHDLDRVFLVAPSSPTNRLKTATQACRGFVYAASTMGVTGARVTVGHTAESLVQRVREVSSIPVCVGLGVSTGEQAAQVAGFADGVIVGSALVRCLAEATDPAAGVEAVAQLSAELSAGVRAGKTFPIRHITR